MKWAVRVRAAVRDVAKYIEIDELLVMICVIMITRLMAFWRFPPNACNESICFV